MSLRSFLEKCVFLTGCCCLKNVIRLYYLQEVVAIKKAPVNFLVGVVGAAIADKTLAEQAYQLGKFIGKKGYILISGGLGGVMEASCQGAREAGGLTIGFLPGKNRLEANPFVTIPLATGLNEGRNYLIASASDILVAIGGGWGTLSEISLGLKMGKKVISLNAFPEFSQQPGFYFTQRVEEATQKIEEILENEK